MQRDVHAILLISELISKIAKLGHAGELHTWCCVESSMSSLHTGVSAITDASLTIDILASVLLPALASHHQSNGMKNEDKVSVVVSFSSFSWIGSMLDQIPVGCLENLLSSFFRCAPKCMYCCERLVSNWSVLIHFYPWTGCTVEQFSDIFCSILSEPMVKNENCQYLLQNKFLLVRVFSRITQHYLLELIGNLSEKISGINIFFLLMAAIYTQWNNILFKEFLQVLL
jgi:hypothetical protein